MSDSAASDDPAPRPIWLCADDYGISESVDKAIRDLLMNGRINADLGDGRGARASRPRKPHR